MSAKKKTTLYTAHYLSVGRVSRIAFIAIFFIFFSLTACTMESLPRNMKLNSFNPHRPEFTCVHEADKVPPIDPQAQEWFEQGFALTSEDNEIEEMNYKAAVDLWQKAAERKHWKALINLASVYAHGRGEGAYRVERDDEKAVLLTEQGMKLGIPSAFDLMGTLHMEGRGVNQDASRAYAFWQLAADMGSPGAMAYIGSQTLGAYNNPARSLWSNIPIGVKMLECAVAQGNAKAAYELGTWLTVIGIHKVPDQRRALALLHSAVKFGSEKAAGYLASSFRGGGPLVGNTKDPARADRYSTLGDALRLNADLRFPNLDKILPLPPATLPKWDGQFKSLVNAAKGVRETPKPAKTSSNYSPNHRAYMPPGTALAIPSNLSRMPVLPGYSSILADRPVSSGLARAPIAGYWQAKSIPAGPNESHYVSSLRTELADLPPLRFEEGERMKLTMGNSNLPHEDITHYLVEWHFAGRPVPMHQPQDWLAKAGIVRAIEAATNTVCKGDKLCPKTGIWQPHVLDADHPLSKVLSDAQLGDGWKWQAFVQEGQAMPSLNALGMPVEDTQVDWRLMQAKPLGFDV